MSNHLGNNFSVMEELDPPLGYIDQKGEYHATVYSMNARIKDRELKLLEVEIKIENITNVDQVYKIIDEYARPLFEETMKPMLEGALEHKGEKE